MYAQNVYQVCSDINTVREIFKSFFLLKHVTRDDLVTTNKADYIRSGRFKKRTRAVFDLADISLLRIPNKGALQVLNVNCDAILLYQYQATPKRFEIFIQHQHYCPKTKLDDALVNFIYQLAGTRLNVQSLHFVKGGGNTGASAIKKIMQAKAGYKIEHYLIDVTKQKKAHVEGVGRVIGDIFDVENGEDWRSVSSTESGQESSDTVLRHSNGRIFDIKEFGKFCLKILEQKIFLSTNLVIRGLRLETNPAMRSTMLRLVDHRPIIQELWTETIDFALTQPQGRQLGSNFAAEQMAMLFNSNQQDIQNTFNTYVWGQKASVVQPHPVRAMLDHIPFLQAHSCFDLSWYNFRQYSLNFIVFAFYFGKNFLTEDHCLTNNWGAVCCNGMHGSGKSRISSILYEYLNGFLYQDSNKGTTEFQNFDIVSKSFIKSDEVNLARLPTSDWKMLADIQEPIKCRVKNQQDVEVTKFVPVVVTSNGDLHKEIILKKDELNIGAAHRRWGFIRYFETWNQAHPEIIDSQFNKISNDYSQFYSHFGVNMQLMNSLVGAALVFSRHSFVTVDYIIPYYTHCLRVFSQTIFGCLMLLEYKTFPQITQTIIQEYQEKDDAQCFVMQRQLEKKYEKMLKTSFYYAVKNTSAEAGELVRLCLIEEDVQPMYFRCLQLAQHDVVVQAIKTVGEQALRQFLQTHKTGPMQLYKKIAIQMEDEELFCYKEIIRPQNYTGDNNSFTQSEHNFDFVEQMLISTGNLQQDNDMECMSNLSFRD